MSTSRAEMTFDDSLAAAATAGKGIEARFTFKTPGGRACVYSSAREISASDWERIFAGRAKDRRYYEILETAVTTGFEYSYIVLEDHERKVTGIQPVFLVFQDLTAGLPSWAREKIAAVRKRWRNFLQVPMLMVGCSAGEGRPGILRAEDAEDLSSALVQFARRVKAKLITFKDVPREHRAVLGGMRNYIRIPSFPNVQIKLQHKTFDEFAQARLSKVTRKGIRRKFRDAEAAGPITMEVRDDVGPYLEEIYGLYRQVFDRSEFRFEELTRDYFRLLGERMPDRTKYFIWKFEGRVVAFSLCFVHGKTISDSYLGMEYPLALDLHLYFVTLRDVVEWAAANGCEHYISTPLNYDPKQHLRFDLDPLDLYVRHPSAWITKLIGPFIRALEPTRHDPVLKRFENFAEIRN